MREITYEIPNVLLEGCSFNRTTENKEYIEEDSKQNCKSISIPNIPQDIVNKIEKKTVRYEVIKSFIPYGFYAYKNNSEMIPMKMGKIGDLTWEHIPGTYADVSAKNLDKVYIAYERLSENREYYIDVYRTNAFGEITYILRTEDGKYDKRDAKKIVSELASQGWEILQDSSEEYFSQDFYQKFPERITDEWTEEDLNKKDSLNASDVFKKIYGIKPDDKRTLVFKQRYKKINYY